MQHVTTDHNLIREWAEDRKGRPTRVTGRPVNADPGALRIQLPGRPLDIQSETVGWDEFFDEFDRLNLAFVYEEVDSTGEMSLYNKIVPRGTMAAEK